MGLTSQSSGSSLLKDEFILDIKLDKNIKGITSKALDALEKYNFYGNVRELQNIIERAIVLTENDYIKEEDLPEEIFNKEYSKNLVIQTVSSILSPECFNQNTKLNIFPHIFNIIKLILFNW